MSKQIKIGRGAFSLPYIQSHRDRQHFISANRHVCRFISENKAIDAYLGQVWDDANPITYCSKKVITSEMYAVKEQPKPAEVKEQENPKKKHTKTTKKKE